MRTYKNGTDQAFVEWAENRGWKPTRRAMPRFAVLDENDQLVLVETKAHPGRKVRREKDLLLKELVKLGVRCCRWDPESGLTEYTGGR